MAATSTPLSIPAIRTLTVIPARVAATTVVMSALLPSPLKPRLPHRLWVIGAAPGRCRTRRAVATRAPLGAPLCARTAIAPRRFTSRPGPIVAGRIAIIILIPFSCLGRIQSARRRAAAGRGLVAGTDWRCNRTVREYRVLRRWQPGRRPASVVNATGRPSSGITRDCSAGTSGARTGTAAA